MRIRDSRPLRTRHADAISDALTAPFGPTFHAAVQRMHALGRAYDRRRATLAAWDLAVSYYRAAETQDLRTAYQTDRQAAIILAPHHIPEIPISVAFGN